MSDFYLMKKVIISKKIQVTMKTVRSTIFQPFQFEPEQKKTCGNESHERETKYIYTSAVNLYILEYEISIGVNVDIAKTKRDK